MTVVEDLLSPAQHEDWGFSGHYMVAPRIQRGDDEEAA